MRDEALEQGCSEPEFTETGFFTTVFRPNPEVLAEAVAQEGAQDAGTPEVTPEVIPEAHLLRALKGEMNRQGLQKALKLKDAEHFRKIYLLPALAAGLIEMTIPDKPRSSKQRYRLTADGREALKKSEEP